MRRAFSYALDESARRVVRDPCRRLSRPTDTPIMKPVVHYGALAPLALVAGLALALAACGKHDESPAPAGTSTAATPALPGSAPAVPGSVPAPAGTAPAGSATVAAAPAPLSVAKLTLGSKIGDDYAVTKARTTFAPNDRTIYAAVNTEGQATGANLNARWTYQDGQTVNDLTQSITTSGPATTTFRIHNPNDWPAGKYKVAISLDGAAAASQDFEITKR